MPYNRSETFALMPQPTQLFIARRSPSKKRCEGIYYTPRPISQMVTDWAIRESSDFILEPSFGGCVFFECAINRLITLGATCPPSHLYGSDRDPEAFKYLQNVVDHRPENFLLADFISLQNSDFRTEKFDVILGNPPYVSLHNMSEEQRAAVANLKLTPPLQLDLKASLWAYFVAHSISFLKENGRIAFVLPSSLVHSYYGRQLLNGISELFAHCKVISIADQCFRSQGTKEKITLLLAEGAFKGPSRDGVSICGVSNVSEARNALHQPQDHHDKSSILIDHATSYLLSKEASAICKNLISSEDVTSLGNLAKIKIGVVTGANRFFILTRTQIKDSQIPRKFLKPILSKFSGCRGLDLTAEDIKENEFSEIPCLLFCPKEGVSDPHALNYLSKFPQHIKEKNQTFKKRPCWHYPQLGEKPDAFLTYMTSDGPVMALNSACTNSTNTIHRIYFNKEVNITHRKAIAISLISSYAQLSAEFASRTYGSGVLKIEPSEAAKIVLPNLFSIHPQTISKIFRRVDDLLRNKKKQEATEYVDQIVAEEVPSLAKRLPIEAVRSALQEARIRRYNKSSI